MSVANGPIDLIEPQRPPGVGDAPDVQPTSFQVVEPSGIPATASLPPQDIGSEPGDIISLDIGTGQSFDIFFMEFGWPRP